MAGNYEIEVSDQSGCRLNKTVQLTEPDLLEVTFDAQAPQCFGTDNGRITIANIEGGTPPYSAELNEESIEVTGATQLSSGTHTLTVRDFNSCLWFEEVNLPQPLQIEVEAGVDQTRISRGEAVLLTAQIFPSGVSENQIRWLANTFDPQLDCLDCLVTSARPKETTIFDFQLQVNDCLYSDQVEVIVDDRDFFIPNVFTPNGDGNNDRFLFFGNRESPLFIQELMIFDRWGQSVYEVRNLNHADFRGWDGQIRGADAAEGVYIYHMILQDGRGDTQRYTGDVSLIR
jgi:gliding motility-associated-like protein